MSDMEFGSQFINYPHGENIYVNRLYRYQQCLISLYYTDNVLERQRQHLVNSIEQIIDGMDAPMRIVVAGGFNAGKSTFINALLGAELMPAKVIRTTAIINCLVAGKNKELTVFRYDNTVKVKTYIDAEHLRSQIEEAMANESAAIHHIDIACPNPEHHFLDKFTLIDTPGLDYNEQDSATSLREVERADALIWVLHNVGITKEDNKNLQRFHTKNPDKPIIVIINQIDDLEDNELESVIKKVQSHTEGWVKKVFPLSAKLAFVGRRDNHDLKYQQSGFFNLNSYLHSNLFNTYGALQSTRLCLSCQAIFREVDDFFNISIEQKKMELERSYSRILKAKQVEKEKAQRLMTENRINSCLTTLLIPIQFLFFQSRSAIEDTKEVIRYIEANKSGSKIDLAYPECWQVNENGTALDLKTKLCWCRYAIGQQWVNGKVIGDQKPMSWLDAMKAIDLFNKQEICGGFADWRLPTHEELMNISSTQDIGIDEVYRFYTEVFSCCIFDLEFWVSTTNKKWFSGDFWEYDCTFNGYLHYSSCLSDIEFAELYSIREALPLMKGELNRINFLNDYLEDVKDRLFYYYKKYFVTLDYDTFIGDIEKIKKNCLDRGERHSDMDLQYVAASMEWLTNHKKDIDFNLDLWEINHKRYMVPHDIERYLRKRDQLEYERVMVSGEKVFFNRDWELVKEHKRLMVSGEKLAYERRLRTVRLVRNG